MKKAKLTKKHIVIIVVLVLACLYGYASISSIRIANEVQKQLAIKTLPTYTAEDGKIQLIEAGYSIVDEVIGNEYSESSHYFTAVKDNSIIDVKAEPPHWVGYYFKHSEESITPFIYDIHFGDSFETVKKKLGVNKINTMFQNIGMFNPEIYMIDNLYILSTRGDCRYFLRFDKNYCLEKIEIKNFWVYD